MFVAHKISISEAFELYRLEVVVFRNQSHKTEEMSRLACKALITFLGDISLSELNFDAVRRWKEDMTKTRSINTVRGYIIKLRVVLAHCRLRGYTALDPDLIGVPKRETTAIDFVTPEEVNRLIDCVFEPRAGYSKVKRYRNRAMVATLYASGIRVSELIGLNRTSIQSDGTFTIIGKGNKPRLCFLDSRAVFYIDQYLKLRKDSCPALFISEQTCDRLSKSTIEFVFRNARLKGGFEKAIHPHMMRHSFATNMLRNNANLFYVSKFLGHSSVQTTEMYTHYVNEDLRKVYLEKHTI